jgi:hypothetical protein
MEILGTHVDFIQLLLAIVAFFMIRTLNKIDRNQGLLFGKINKVEGRLNRLLGAHDVNHRTQRRRFDEEEESE